MDGIASVAGAAVGVVLIAAGVLKLVEGPGWLKQAADMNVARLVAVVVPYVELLLGALLVAGFFMPWTAVAALGLLVAFTYVIVQRLRDGSRPPCACFGSRSKRPLGAYHVARNLALVLAALVAVVWR
jgi:uncharacterized membrane protein YphA (DoxX/SURF4 family)